MSTFDDPTFPPDPRCHCGELLSAHWRGRVCPGPTPDLQQPAAGREVPSRATDDTVGEAPNMSGRWDTVTFGPLTYPKGHVLHVLPADDWALIADACRRAADPFGDIEEHSRLLALAELLEGK